MEKVILNQEIIDRSGKSGYRISKDIGIAQGTWYNILKGAHAPTLVTARKISLAVNVSLDQLIFPAEVKIPAL